MAAEDSMPNLVEVVTSELNPDVGPGYDPYLISSCSAWSIKMQYRCYSPWMADKQISGAAQP